jgi:hypothetical protein
MGTRGSSVALTDVMTSARFLIRLPGFLRRPLDLEGARRIVEDRQAERPRLLLERIRGVFEASPPGPYAALLRSAGCELGDIERLVRTEGVEGALHALYRAGVYLTLDEFKGRRPVVRGPTTVAVSPGELRNSRSARHLPARSSGSRGPGTAVVFDLAFIRDCAAATAVFLDARGGLGWGHADWETPGGGSLFRLLKVVSLGRRPARWFSQVDVAAPGLPPRYRWSARLVRALGALGGPGFPAPEYVPVDRPGPVVRWMRRTLDEGGTPHLFTFASSAVRLCQAALEAGLELPGAQLTLMGEPVTEARLATIRRTGATGLPRYGTIECGPIGYGCLAGTAADDVHVLSDLQAVIQPGPGASLPGVSPRGVLVTSGVGARGPRSRRAARATGDAIGQDPPSPHGRSLPSRDRPAAAGSRPRGRVALPGGRRPRGARAVSGGLGARARARIS